jgi:hypothetical protein
VEDVMKRVSTKGLCATAVATFLCTACHADGLTKQQVRELLEENNQILTNAMKDNTEALAKVISADNGKLIATISDSNATLGKNLTEAIEKLGARITVSDPSQPVSPQIYVHKTVRHIHVHKYVFCCRVIWYEDPCFWPW